MAKDCAGCRSLTAAANIERVPVFLEPILWPSGLERSEGGRAYQCLACGERWVDRRYPAPRRFVRVCNAPPIPAPAAYSPAARHRDTPVRHVPRRVQVTQAATP